MRNKVASGVSCAVDQQSCPAQEQIMIRSASSGRSKKPVTASSADISKLYHESMNREAP